MHEFIDSNLSQINNDFFVLQYLKKTDYIWCPDFLLGGNAHLISRLYSSMYNRFRCNQDLALSIHQDLALTICSIFSSPFFIFMPKPRLFSFKKSVEVFVFKKYFSRMPSLENLLFSFLLSS